jgi:outer membrane beta-barrel protein
MRHSRLSFITVILIVLFSFTVFSDDLFDLDSGFGSTDDETEEAPASSIFDAEPAAPAEKEAAKEAPKTAQLEVGAAAADTEGEKELRDLSVERKKKIKVVQRKEFYKDGRFEIGVDVGMISGDWENVLVVGARMAYHFNEYLALQGRFLYGAVSWENETLKQADEADAYVAKSNMTMSGGLSLVFTPFYGKLSIFGDIIPKYDINVSAGGYFYQTKAEDKNQSVKALTNNNGAFQIGFAPRIFLGKNASLSVNSDWFIMKDTRPKQEGGDAAYLKSDFMITLNVSMLLPFAK